MLLQMAGFSSFSWLNNFPFYVCYIPFIYLSTGGYLHCFSIFALVNNAATNVRVQISLQDLDFISFI